MINSEIQNQLRDRFNPEGSMLRKQQLRMLEILQYIDEVCKENNIRYWLSSGTLLGAVRHGGFIPWDDDLDIEMLKEDYIKFIKVFRNNDKFAIQNNTTDSNYFLNYSKIRDLNSQIEEFNRSEIYKYNGLFVDVFCLEQMPLITCKLYGKVFGKIEKLNQDYHKEKLPRFLIKCLRKGALLSFALLRPFNKLFSNELHHSYGSSFMKERYIKDIFPITSIQFEGSLFPAPGNTDKYLRIIFGNYHQLPDLNSISTHISKCTFFK